MPGAVWVPGMYYPTESSQLPLEAGKVCTEMMRKLGLREVKALA